MAGLAKVKDDFLPKDLAALALSQSGNVIADATEWALNWMSDHPEWEVPHLDAMRRRWIMEQLACEAKNQRYVSTGGSPARRAGDSAQTTVVPFQSQLNAAISDNYARMMDAPIWGGKRIGDATPTEIRESAAQFATNGKSMLRKAHWQLAVAEAAEANGVGPTDKIRDSLPERTLAKLWEESGAV